MLDKATWGTLESLWREGNSINRTVAARAESKASALRLIMRSVFSAIASTVDFWHASGIIDLITAAEAGQAIDSGGSSTKESHLAEQALLQSFVAWANATTVTIDGVDYTLPASPKTMIQQQPEKVSS